MKVGPQCPSYVILAGKSQEWSIWKRACCDAETGIWEPPPRARQEKGVTRKETHSVQSLAGDATLGGRHLLLHVLEHQLATYSSVGDQRLKAWAVRKGGRKDSMDRLFCHGLVRRVQVMASAGESSHHCETSRNRWTHLLVQALPARPFLVVKKDAQARQERGRAAASVRGGSGIRKAAPGVLTTRVTLDRVE